MTSTKPSTPRGDADYWGLSLLERDKYYGRIAAHYGDLAARDRGLAAHYFERARQWTTVVIVVVTVATIFLFTALILHIA